MKTTLKQQINAISQSRENFERNLDIIIPELGEKAAKKTRALIDALNDAGSTIAAVQFIGMDEITHVQELIRCAKIVCGKLDPIENVSAFADLVSVLRKMGHGKVKVKIVSKIVECDIHHAMSHNYKIVG